MDFKKGTTNAGIVSPSRVEATINDEQRRKAAVPFDCAHSVHQLRRRNMFNHLAYEAIDAGANFRFVAIFRLPPHLAERRLLTQGHILPFIRKDSIDSFGFPICGL
jgi:hypothetical protein